MSWVDRSNAAARHVRPVKRSSLAELFPANHPRENVSVTCGTPRQRAAVFYHILYRAVSAGMPAVVLYSTEETERQLRQNPSTIFIMPDRPLYMPLLGMNVNEARNAFSFTGPLRDWALNEQEALRVYLNLLVSLGLPISLRHLHWLVHLDRDSFESYLNSVRNLSERDRSSYLAVTKPYYGGTPPLIAEIRTRISLMDEAAAREGIFDMQRRDTSCSSALTAVRNNSVLGIRLDSEAASRHFLDMLCDELRILKQGDTPFLLACCDMTIPEGSPLAGMVRNASGMMTTFLSMDHAPDAFPSQRNDYWKGMLKGSRLILNCFDSGKAPSYEELFGTYRYVREVHTDNWSRQLLHILPTHGTTTITSEETLPKILQGTLSGNPRGGVFESGDSNTLTIIGDLGL